MAGPDDAVQGWLSRLPFKVKRELAKTIKAEADGLKEAIQTKAPRGKTGNLAASVQVRRKKNDLDLEVTAGGDLTSKAYGRATDYSSEVEVGSGDTGGREKVALGEGAKVSYDYTRAVEFGTVKMPAQPFFWPTYRSMAPQIRQRIEEAVDRAQNS